MEESLDRLEAIYEEKVRDEESRKQLHAKGTALEQGRFTVLPIVFEMIDSYVSSTATELVSLPPLDPAVIAAHAVFKAFEQFRSKFRQDVRAAIDFATGVEAQD